MPNLSFSISQVAIAYFKATPAKRSIDTPHLFIINLAGMFVRDYSDSGLTSFLEGEADLDKQVQSLITETA